MGKASRRNISLAPVPAPVDASNVVDLIPIEASEATSFSEAELTSAKVAAPAETAPKLLPIPAFDLTTRYRLTAKGLLVSKRGASAYRYALHSRSPEGETVGAFAAKAGKKAVPDMRWGFERGFYEIVKPAE